jgi:hypothetical protein
MIKQVEELQEESNHRCQARILKIKGTHDSRSD